jgi:hypothetical protein
MEEVDLMVDFRYLNNKEEFRPRVNSQNMAVGGGQEQRGWDLMGKLGNMEEVSGGLGVRGGKIRRESVMLDLVDSKPYVFPPEGKNLILINEGLDSEKVDGKLLASQNKAENCRHQGFDTGNPAAWSKKSGS